MDGKKQETNNPSVTIMFRSYLGEWDINRVFTQGFFNPKSSLYLTICEYNVTPTFIFNDEGWELFMSCEKNLRDIEQQIKKGRYEKFKQTDGFYTVSARWLKGVVSDEESAGMLINIDTHTIQCDPRFVDGSILPYCCGDYFGNTVSEVLNTIQEHGFSYSDVKLGIYLENDLDEILHNYVLMWVEEEEFNEELPFIINHLQSLSITESIVQMTPYNREQMRKYLFEFAHKVMAEVSYIEDESYEEYLEETGDDNLDDISSFILFAVYLVALRSI